MEWYVERRIQSVGFLWNKSGGAWQGRFLSENELRSSTLQTLVEKKRIEEIQTEGIKEPFYFSIKNWWWEPKVEQNDEMREMVVNEIARFTKKYYKVRSVAK